MILSIVVYSIFFVYTVVSICFYMLYKPAQIVFSNDMLVLAAGMFAYILLRILAHKARDFFNFIDTFTHENAHLIFSFLTFSKVYSFSSTLRRGGEIKTKKLNPIIVLSPYTIPIIPLIIGLLALIIKEQYLFAFIFMGGLFTAHFYHTSIKDAFFSKQPDIAVYGKIRSIMIIIISYITVMFFIFHTVNYSLMYNIEVFVQLYRGVIQ